MEHPGGSVSRLLVCARNLSAGGMAFFHGGFLHPGTVCKIALRKRDGAVFAVAGMVVNCRHVEGAVHEVGLKFDQRIEPELFLESRGISSDNVPTSLAVPNLHGSMLLVDADPRTSLVGHHLRATGIEVSTVGSPVEALTALKKGQFDLAACDLNLKGHDGVEMIRKMRAGGFAGPIVVVTAETDEGRLAAAREAGAVHTLRRPHDPNALFALLAKLHRELWTSKTGGGAPPTLRKAG
jgi:CheY-like chemotaxis protein